MDKIYQGGEGLVFSSILFLFFFLTALLVCYFLLPAKFRRGRNLVLLVFSLVFYSCAGLRATPIILVSILGDYAIGRILENSKRPKVWLTLGIVLHLGLIFWFKYAVFTITNLNRLGLNLPVPEIVLPIGISFFTFQGLSYLIDVYRREVPAEKSLANLALYISLFPQLIAGPIVRYQTVAEEIVDRRESAQEAAQGASRFLVGLSKKVLLSNALAQMADAAFQSPTGSLSTALAWLGAVAYTGHIYFDFSGYSDMAIGLGRVFGFHFLENFNYPYISRSVTEFWRRWHISLSSWFRDYLYIPLGGSRRGGLRTVFNLFVVWACTGLWHGAAWNFIVWGLYYFVLLVGEKWCWGKTFSRLPRVFQHGYALMLVILGWVWFRADSLPAALGFFGAMFHVNGGPWMENQVLYLLRQFWPELVAAPLACLPIVPWLKEKVGEKVWAVAASRLALLGLGGLSVCRLLSSGFNPFIYFRF